jgi:hypothetical protein
VPSAQVANLMALILAWVYVFDTVSKEREMLEVPEQDVYGTAADGQAFAHPQQREQPAAAADAAAVGHAVTLPPEVDPELATHTNFYGNITGAGACSTQSLALPGSSRAGGAQTPSQGRAEEPAPTPEAGARWCWPRGDSGLLQQPLFLRKLRIASG